MDNVTPIESPGGSALARGIAVLQAFTAERPTLTARELIAITGLPKPTLFRLTGTLCETGLLRYDEVTGCFTPAPGMARLAAPLLSRTSIRQLAFGPMQALAERLCAQVSLGIGLGRDLVFIELAQAKECVTVRPGMGTRISLSRTASGRAYLNVVPAEIRERYLSDVPGADQLRERLAQAKDELTQHGFCINRGELVRHLDAVAVPLHPAREGGEIYVFACAVPSFELRDGQLLNDVGPRLLTLARGIEAGLGVPPPQADDASPRARGESRA